MEVNMEKLFVKKLDDGKEFKIMVRLINNSVAVPFGTLCEYLGISRTYWAKKLIHDLIRSDEGFIFLSTFQFRAKKIYPRTLEGEYWKKVILSLNEAELLFYKSHAEKDQYQIEIDNLRFELLNANENIEFLQDKNKELKKQQRKLNQALGIDLLNMAQQLLNIKEV
jgi:hypothetical protein